MAKCSFPILQPRRQEDFRFVLAINLSPESKECEVKILRYCLNFEVRRVLHTVSLNFEEERKDSKTMVLKINHNSEYSNKILDIFVLSVKSISSTKQTITHILRMTTCWVTPVVP